MTKGLWSESTKETVDDGKRTARVASFSFPLPCHRRLRVQETLTIAVELLNCFSITFIHMFLRDRGTRESNDEGTQNKQQNEGDKRRKKVDILHRTTVSSLKAIRRDCDLRSRRVTIE